MIHLLTAELLKLFARKRTYMGFAAFLCIEILILLLLRLEGVQRSLSRMIEQNGYLAEEYLSGLTLGLLIMLWSVFLLGGLYLALVAGDVVAKDVEDGTMRMMLCRPVSRVRLILGKYAACALYTAFLVGFIGITAMLTGWLQAGWGGLFVFAPLEGVFALHEPGPGLLRYLASMPLLTMSLLTVTSLALFFSCCPMKPAAATILTLSFFFVDSIIRNIPYFEDLRGWFVTSRMSSWIFVFEYRIPWEKLVEDMSWLLAINATLVILGIAIFQSRDMKS